jgi:hypothetical protein
MLRPSVDRDAGRRTTLLRLHPVHIEVVEGRGLFLGVGGGAEVL